MRIIAAALFIALAAVVTAASPARADVPSEAARIAAACNAAGGFGYRFGEPESPEVIGRATESALPFHVWKPEFTHHSRLIRTVDAVILMADEDTAIAVIAETGKRLVAAGFKPGEDHDDYVLAGADGGPGFRVGLLQMGNGVLVECGDLALGQRHRDEVFGKPTRMERPVAPSLGLPPPPAADVCEASDSRAAFNQAFMGRLNMIAAYAESSGSYTERLGLWKGQQLRDKGVWTKGDENVFRNRLISSPTYMQSAQRSAKALMPILTVLETYADAQEAGDAVGECRAALKVDGMMRRMVADQTLLWTFVEGRFAAEAKRLNVTID